MRYEIRFKVRKKFEESFQEGSHKFNRLDKLAEFIERMKNKYEKCEFEKYDNGQLVSSFS